MAEYPMYNEIYSNPPTPGANAPSHQQYHQQQQQDPSSSTSATVMGGYPQWETLDAHALVDHSPLQDLEEMDTPTPTAPGFDFQPHGHPALMPINLDDPPRIVPSQLSPIDNAPILLHHPSEVPLHHHRPSPPAHSQMRNYSGRQHYRTHTPSPLSPDSQLLPLNAPLPHPPPPSASKPTGPIRSSARAGRATQANPYYRPLPPNLPGLATPFGMGGPGAAHLFPPSSVSSAAASPTSGGRAAAAAPMTRQQTARRPSQTVRFSETNLAPKMVRREAAPQNQARSVPSPSTEAGSQAPRASSSSSPQNPSHHSQGPPKSHHPTSSSSAQDQNQNAAKLPSHTARLPLSTIPSDVTYQASDCTLVAQLDLPGVRREALRITLGTCYFNRVRYVCVVGIRAANGVGTSSGSGSQDLYEIFAEKPATSTRGKERESGDFEMDDSERETDSQPPQGSHAHGRHQEEEESADDNPPRRRSRDIKEELAGFGIPQPPSAAPPAAAPASQPGTSTPQPTSETQIQPQIRRKNLTSRLVNPNVRERKHGVMRRVFQVPGTTELKDIDAALNDGVLTLRIHCGAPFEEDDEVDVPVRIG